MNAAESLTEFNGLLARETAARARRDHDIRDTREIASSILTEVGFPDTQPFVDAVRAKLIARDVATDETAA